MDYLKVMSYNIHSGIGRDGKYSLDRIRDAIRVENPDFIALQEVDVGLRKSHFDDQPAKLAEELNYFPYFCLTRVIERGTYGILTLSRYPIIERRKYDLSFRNDMEPRGISRIDVKPGHNGLIDVYNIHLGLGVRERSYQRQLMLSDSILLNRSRKIPKIIMGDFNDRFISVVHGRLSRHFIDVFNFLRIKRRSTFRWRKITLRLDHIYVSEQFQPVDAYVVKNKLTDQASDHYPIVGILQIKNGKADN